MTAARRGVVLYATGDLVVPSCGPWIGIADSLNRAQQLRISLAATSPNYQAATRAALAHLADLEGEVRRIDLVWWYSGDLAALDSDALLTASLPIDSSLWPTDDGSGWPSPAQWPMGWHALTSSQRAAFTATTESRGQSRIWFLASEAGYDEEPGRHSISSLLEVDDETGRLGALAAYAIQLGKIRQHLTVSMANAGLLDDAEIEDLGHAPAAESPGPAETHPSLDDGPADADERRIWYVKACKEQQRALTGIETVGFNLTRDRRRLQQRLNDLAGTTGSWAPLIHDRTQYREAVATTRYNAARAMGAQQHVDAELLRRAAEHSGRSARANTMATLLLTATAGGLGAAQLVAGGRDRVGIGLTASGVLLAIGMLIIDAATGYTRAHALIAGVSLAGAAIGLGLVRSFATAVLLGVGATGFLLGVVVTRLANEVAVQGVGRRVRRWLSGPVS